MEAKIIYTDFSGKRNKFQKLTPHFCVDILEEDYKKLKERHYNVKKTKDGTYILPVRLKLDSKYIPDPVVNVYLNGESEPKEYNKDNIKELDDMTIDEVITLDVKPYEYEVCGKIGRVVYLEKLEIKAHKEDENMNNTDICICEDDTIDFANFDIALGVIGKINTNAWISLDHPKAKDKMHPAIAIGTSIDGNDDLSESIYENTQYIDISYCPFCGRKLV